MSTCAHFTSLAPPHFPRSEHFPRIHILNRTKYLKICPFQGRGRPVRRKDTRFSRRAGRSLFRPPHPAVSSCFPLRQWSFPGVYPFVDAYRAQGARGRWNKDFFKKKNRPHGLCNFFHYGDNIPSFIHGIDCLFEHFTLVSKITHFFSKHTLSCCYNQAKFSRKVVFQDRMKLLFGKFHPKSRSIR